MQADKIVVQNNTQNKSQKIQMQPNEKKIETKIQKPVSKSEKKQTNLMKLYVYGSCESDQFRHPNKLSQSKRPICITNIQKFDLNEQQDEQQQATNKALNIYINPLFKKSIYKIACGGLHSVVLTSDGKAYTFGCNDEGALGRKGPQCIPMQVPLDCPVDLVSAGDNHTMFANSINGVVFFTGNYNYLRGQKMIQSVKQPIKFTTASIDIRNKNHPIQKLQSGANHTVILVNNRIFCRGQPQSFTTGRRINQRRKTDSSLTFDGVGLTHVLDVWCGGYHTVAKVKKGKDFLYYTWGKNDQGQLGIGNFKSQAFPVEIKGLRGKNIIKTAAGGFFTLFLTQSGQILGCGTNQYGQLGLGEDYQFVPSQPQSEQQDNQEDQKSGQLEKVVEGLKISDIDKQKMISQSQQKVIPNLPNIAVEQPKIQKPAEQQVQKKKYEQNNTYIKSVRPLVFPEQVTPKSMIANISAGAEFSFAWNNLTQLYSWGFGMNYVLLNGEQNQQYEPFKVRNKIFNDQIIEQVKAGGQHVLYTAYEKSEDKNKPNVQLDKRVTELLVPEKGKLSRKRKN